MANAKIVSSPKVLNGKPVIAGTRISVELIMNFLGAGMSVKEILAEYPELKKSEIIAAIEYATRLVARTKKEYITDSASAITLHEISR